MRTLYLGALLWRLGRFGPLPEVGLVRGGKRSPGSLGALPQLDRLVDVFGWGHPMRPLHVAMFIAQTKSR